MIEEIRPTLSNCRAVSVGALEQLRRNCLHWSERRFLARSRQKNSYFGLGLASGCGARHRARGLCQHHLKDDIRAGLLIKVKPRSGPIPMCIGSAIAVG